MDPLKTRIQDPSVGGQECLTAAVEISLFLPHSSARNVRVLGRDSDWSRSIFHVVEFPLFDALERRGCTLRSMKDLEDYAIGATDAIIGHVKDFYFDDEACYRDRQNKVTHDGSTPQAADALLAWTSTTARVQTCAIAPLVPENCHFCHWMCSNFARLAPLSRCIFLLHITQGMTH